MKKATMTLETLGKALLVLAVVIILLIIFRTLIKGGAENIDGSSKKAGELTSKCIPPTNPECDWLKSKPETANEESQDDTSDE